MIISMEEDAHEGQIQHVLQRIKECGFDVYQIIRGVRQTVIAVIGVGTSEALSKAMRTIEACPGVQKVVAISSKFKRVSREIRQETTVVRINDDLSVGGDQFFFAAGPCSVEGKRQVSKIAEAVQRRANAFRGGAFKPRTGPDAFEGMGIEGLRLLQQARDEFNLPVVTEVMSESDVDAASDYVDILQIGARNMQNFRLLDYVGRQKLPALLKRHYAATVEEWLLAAERIVKGGNPNVILCERGIRTFTETTRFTLDIGAIITAKRMTHLPVIFDPSHPAGKSELVLYHARAGIAAGADGMIVEVHNNPEKALSDGRQSLDFEQFDDLCDGIDPYIKLWQQQRKMLDFDFVY